MLVLLCYLYRPLMSEVVVFMFHSFFFWGGGGVGRISHCLNLIPFVTQLPYTLPRYNPWQLFLKETPHFQSAPLSLCTLRSWPLLLWGLQLWNHKMTGSFSSNTCREIAQSEVLIRWSILWGIHFSLQKRKSLPRGTFTSYMLMSLFFKMFAHTS